VRIENKTKGTVIAVEASLAGTFLSRLLGLIPKKSLRLNEALLIPRCQSIHMFFMRFPIDAIFVGGENRVVGLTQNLKPFTLSPVFWRASFVIELPVGKIKSSGTSYGDVIEIREA